MAPNDPSADVRANADLLRQLAATIGLTGATLVEVCERIILALRAEAVLDAATRRTTSPSEGTGDL